MRAMAEGRILTIRPFLARIKIAIYEIDAWPQVPSQRRMVEVGASVEYRHGRPSAARDRMSLWQAQRCWRPLSVIVVGAAASGPRGSRHTLGRRANVVRLGV